MVFVGQSCSVSTVLGSISPEPCTTPYNLIVPIRVLLSICTSLSLQNLAASFKPVHYKGQAAIGMYTASSYHKFWGLVGDPLNKDYSILNNGRGIYGGA